MKTIQLKDLPRGEFFKRKPTSGKVYTRGVYDRTVRKYCCDDWDDISRCIELRGTTIVFVDFEF